MADNQPQTSNMPFKRVATLTVAAGAVAAVIILLPPRAMTLAEQEGIAQPVRGAIHIHTRRSDGSGTIDQIAQAAARAGLRFVVLTDHGYGTRTPEPPSYRFGVLCIDAVEVSTFQGHVVVLGLTGPAPYALGGEPHAVIEDVSRLGGVSIAAHPGSSKRSLQWDDWNSGFDGLEWLNGDSEWRDEQPLSLARALLTYPLRQAETMATLLDRPRNVMSRWDQLTGRRRVIALAAADAHASMGLTGGSNPYGDRSPLALPGYEHIFRTFSIALPELRLTGEPTSDAQAVVREIRSGHIFSSIDALASPARLSFSASSGGYTAKTGDDLPVSGPVAIRVNTTAPAGARIDLLRNGVRVSSSVGASLEYTAPAEPGVFRVEVYLSRREQESGVPWLLSNPIYVGRSEVPGEAEHKPVETATRYADGPPGRDWGIEKSDQSQGVLESSPTVGGSRMSFRYALAGSTAEGGAYVALMMLTCQSSLTQNCPQNGPALAEYDRLMFSARADKPMRLWVQLWLQVHTGNRYWRRSVYLDNTEREVSVKFDDLKPADATTPAHPPLSDVQSIMFVVDQLHTPLGTGGRVLIDDVRYGR